MKALPAHKKMAIYAVLDAIFLAVCAYFLWSHSAVPAIIPQIGFSVGILIEMFLGIKGWTTPQVPPQQ